jgi:hypothetical protein
MASNQVVVTVEDEFGKEVKRVTTSFPGQHKFDNLPPGEYKAYVYFPDGRKVEAEGDDTLPNGGTLKVFLSERRIHLPTSTSPPKRPLPKLEERPPWKAIVSFTAGASFLSNFGGAEPLIREIVRQLADDVPPPRSSTPNQPRSNPQPRNPHSQARYNRLFSPSVEARLRACIQSNFVRLSGIPTLSNLLKSLSWEREPSGEFERQLILAYRRVKQLQTTLKKCDPTLIPEILVAQEKIAASDPQSPNDIAEVGEGLSGSELQATVIVIGPLVNLRAGPSTHHIILEQVRYGTTLIIDQATLASLSQSERLSIEQGTGWLPVLLLDGRRGHIYSLYVTAQTSP